MCCTQEPLEEGGKGENEEMLVLIFTLSMSVPLESLIRVTTCPETSGRCTRVFKKLQSSSGAPVATSAIETSSKDQ